MAGDDNAQILMRDRTMLERILLVPTGRATTVSVVVVGGDVWITDQFYPVLDRFYRFWIDSIRFWIDSICFGLILSGFGSILSGIGLILSGFGSILSVLD
jgi:hypothetical protein